jgi:(R,R)-butanediol dehydrogenase/meso-butanediol dehydrogenase/diacetyl reductase
VSAAYRARSVAPADDYRAVIALMPQRHHHTTGWVVTIPFSGVVEHGFAELRAGRKMKLLVDPTI